MAEPLRVLNDGVIGRANKLAKKLVNLNVSGWEWLAQLKGGTQQSTNETEQTGAHFEEVISGRAVLSMPKHKGGFRLRYGRSINTGLSAIGIHPAVAVLLDYPVVAGTQVKVDLPGKAATIAFVDSIEGPTVLLPDGTVRRVSSVAEAEELRGKPLKIIDLGDVLISYGDFLENNKNLPPSPYVSEWWAQDVQNALVSVPDAEQRLSSVGSSSDRVRSLIMEPLRVKPSAKEALEISRSLGVPLHPTFTPRFDRLSVPDIIELRKNYVFNGLDAEVDITSPHLRWILQTALIEHRIEGPRAILSGEMALVLSELLNPSQNTTATDNIAGEHPDQQDFIHSLSGIRLGRQTTTTIGIRVARPEKAMVRRMKPPVHALFPVGSAGGPTRNINKAAKQGTIDIDVTNMLCASCGERRMSSKVRSLRGTDAEVSVLPALRHSHGRARLSQLRIKTTTYSPDGLRSARERLDQVRTKMVYDQSKAVKGVKRIDEPVQDA